MKRLFRYNNVICLDHTNVHFCHMEVVHEIREINQLKFNRPIRRVLLVQSLHRDKGKAYRSDFFLPVATMS